METYDKQFKQLDHFVKANGIDCNDCIYFNNNNMDCIHPNHVKSIVEWDSDKTYNAYPIASAMRANGGKCGVNGKLLIAKFS